MPHLHILSFLAGKDKPKTTADIDRIVCAEIPDPNTNPFLHELVKSKMIHGPCGEFNSSSPCMVNAKKKCEKEYPKRYHPQTTTTEKGITTYRRRAVYDGGHLFTKKVKGEEKTFGNRWVVPYNPLLLLKYKCHINVESCTTTGSVKYLFKYVMKGSDSIAMEVKKCEKETGKAIIKDEIESFTQGRYYDSTQSTHRIFGFTMCHRYPPVQKLQLHLENEQSVIFEEDKIVEALEKSERTQLTEFFKLNRQDPSANRIFYPDIPSMYTWNTTQRKWNKRIQKKTSGK